jgi:SAM-dependent methyltransferase
MASDKRWVLSKAGRGPGVALDLGGGSGELHDPLVERGFEYVNADLEPSGPGACVADAHDLPFAPSSFDLVLSSDSLEHFRDPFTVVREVERVLKPTGRFVIWVPFLHPFHSTDFYRYTPLGLRHLLEGAGLRVESIDAPLGLFSLLAQFGSTALQPRGGARLERRLEAVAAVIDSRLGRLQPGGSFAAFYLAVATKNNG